MKKKMKINLDNQTRKKMTRTKIGMKKIKKMRKRI